jgi:metal-dependent hydrolase (beta-lactamase superfamily II)
MQFAFRRATRRGWLHKMLVLSTERLSHPVRGLCKYRLYNKRQSPCNLLLGGFHIHNAEERKYQIIADYLKEYLPRQIGVCHCTGVDKYAFFYKDFGDRVFYNYTGKLIQTDLLK